MDLFWKRFTFLRNKIPGQARNDVERETVGRGGRTWKEEEGEEGEEDDEGDVEGGE